MDDTYQTYVNRVAQMTLPANYKHELQNIQKSAKFEGGKPTPFPGYSVMTPPWRDNSENEEFYNYLNSRQQELLQQLDPGLMIPVPAESFHWTVADLIWDSSYRDAVAKNPQFETQLISRICESFQHYRQSVDTTGLIQLQLLGLSVFTRAIVACLVPKDEQGYERIVQLRRSIYQNSGLIALGIEQQYHFTAHVTFGYFGEIASNLDRDRLASILASLNDRWLETEPPVQTIRQAQLRKFEDMMSYEREPDWPVVEF